MFKPIIYIDIIDITLCFLLKCLSYSYGSAGDLNRKMTNMEQLRDPNQYSEDGDSDTDWDFDGPTMPKDYKTYLRRKKKEAVQAQIKARKAKQQIFDVKIKWKAKPRVDSVNKSYTPSPVNNTSPTFISHHQWSGKTKLKHGYISERVYSSQFDFENEREKFHNKAKEIPGLVHPRNENVQSPVLAPKWTLLPKIEQEGKKTKQTHLKPSNSQTVLNEMVMKTVKDSTIQSQIQNIEKQNNQWVPDIENIAYNPKLKQWVALGYIKPERNDSNNAIPNSDSRNTSPDQAQHKNFNRKPLKNYNDPDVIKRIRNYKSNIRVKKSKTERSKSVLSYESSVSASGFLQPSKSVSYVTNNISWNIPPPTPSINQNRRPESRNQSALNGSRLGRYSAMSTPAERPVHMPYVYETSGLKEHQDE